MSDIAPQQTSNIGPDMPIEPPLSRNGHENLVLEQHGIRPDASSSQWCYILEQSLSPLLQSPSYWYPTSDDGHETDQYLNGISTHANLCIPAQVLRQLLRHDAFTRPPSFANGDETLVDQNGTPYYALWMIPGPELDRFLQLYEQPASGFPLSGNGQEIPIGQNGSPLFSIPAESLNQFLQPYVIEVRESLLFCYENEAQAEHQLDDDGEDDSMSVSDMSSQSQDPDQVDAETHEASSPSTSLGCPVCRETFYRLQERNRHIESYLPHSIICSFQSCTWTGRRPYDFKVHWKKKHTLANAGKVLEDAGADKVPEDANELYDPKHFVKLIVDGMPVKEVARGAFEKVQMSLGRLGKQHVGAKVLGRNRDLKKWISSLHPNLTVS